MVGSGAIMRRLAFSGTGCFGWTIPLLVLIWSRPLQASTGISPRTMDLHSLAERIGREEGIDPRLLLAVMKVESNFRPDARSQAGAYGLMQLMPGTAARFGVVDRGDPLQNVRGGARYLNWLLNFFDGNLVLALAGYNAGEDRVLRAKGIPALRETRAYVPAVLRVLHRGVDTTRRVLLVLKPAAPRIYSWRDERGLVRISCLRPLDSVVVDEFSSADAGDRTPRLPSRRSGKGSIPPASAGHSPAYAGRRK